MDSWMFTLRGIRYRPGRSLVVALIAIVATAAAVVVPAYGRAASQSVLTDTVADTPPPLAGITATIGAHRSGTAPTLAEAADGLNTALARYPTLAGHLGPPLATSSVSASIVDPRGISTQYVYREGGCQHVRVMAGSCADEAGEVMVSARAAPFLNVAVGGTVRLVADADHRPVDEPVNPRVVGLYETIEPDGPYWRFSVSFPGVLLTKRDGVFVDAILAGAEQGVIASAARPHARVERWLNDRPVLLDEQAALLSDIEGLHQTLVGQDIVTDSLLPSVLLTTVDRQQRAVASSFPLITVPLVLLCWLVLFLVAASVTEERGPEIAVGKLRGLRLTQVRRFGLREPVLLATVGVAAGGALGLVVTELGARAFLADGARAELRWPVFAWLGAALVGATVAAGLATRRTVGAEMATLMRRVPVRAGRRMAAAEAAVAALCAAAIVDVVVDARPPSPSSPHRPSPC